MNAQHTMGDPTGSGKPNASEQPLSAPEQPRQSGAQSAADSSAPVIYYRDEVNDEFSGVTRKPFPIDGSYRYLHKNPLWKLAEFLVYRVIMTPFAYLYCHCKFHTRIVNRRLLRQAGKQGCFIYGNHTLMAGDAFHPSLVAFPRKTKVVVNSDNLAVPLTRKWIELSGAIPVPTAYSASRSFLNALEKSVLLGHAIQIYPEAHIWPYYTGIRPFGSASFRYPVRFGAPVYCTTTTYAAPKHGKPPRVTVYVDGPFYPDPGLSDRENEHRLRDTVYRTMCERAKNSSYQPIRYVRQED